MDLHYFAVQLYAGMKTPQCKSSNVQVHCHDSVDVWSNHERHNQFGHIPEGRHFDGRARSARRAVLVGSAEAARYCCRTRTFAQFSVVDLLITRTHGCACASQDIAKSHLL